MRKTFVLLSFMALCLSACRNHFTPSQIEGKWKIVDLEYPEKLSPAMQESVNAALAQLSSREWIFDPAGKLTIRNNGQLSIFAWQLSGDQLSITAPSSPAEEYKVLEAGKTQMKWERRKYKSVVIYKFIKI
jgi:hypothetical protein